MSIKDVYSVCCYDPKDDRYLYESKIKATSRNFIKRLKKVVLESSTLWGGNKIFEQLSCPEQHSQLFERNLLGKQNIFIDFVFCTNKTVRSRDVSKRPILPWAA